MRSAWMWLTLGLFLGGLTGGVTGCGGVSQPQRDLLGELRDQHHQLTGEASDPKQQNQTSQQGSLGQQTLDRSKMTESEITENGRSLDEVRLITPAMLEKRYPSHLFISGVGYTEEVDLNQAILNAKEQVAAAVSSQIESELTVKLSAGRETKNDRMQTQSSSSSSQTTIQRVTFDQAELIEVDVQQTGCDEDRCVAVAYLERKLLAREEMGRFTPLAERFKRAAMRALKSQQKQSFSSAYQASEALYAQLTPLGLQLTTILTAQGFPEWPQLQALRLKVQAKRDELMAELPLVIDTTAISDPRLAAILSEETRASLLALGAETRPFFGGPSPCQGQPPEALHLKLSGALKTQRLSGLPIYVLPYHTTVTHCQSQAVIARFEQALKFSAPPNKSFEEHAQEKLKQTQHRSQQQLYQALRLNLPLDPPSTGAL